MDIDPAIIRVMETFHFNKGLAKRVVETVRQADEEAHSFFKEKIEWCDNCGKPKNTKYTCCTCKKQGRI